MTSLGVSGIGLQFTGQNPEGSGSTWVRVSGLQVQALGHPGHCCVRPRMCAAMRVEVTWQPKKLKLDVRASFLIGFFFFFFLFYLFILKIRAKTGHSGTGLFKLSSRIYSHRANLVG